MRAKILGEGNVTRLIESARQISRLQYRAQDRGGIIWIGAQVAIAQIGRGKERWSSR